MKTSELTGAALDWAVGTALKLPDPYWNGVRCAAYSTDWSQGGPIIERERIDIRYTGQTWDAARQLNEYDEPDEWFGSTPLIAAMRCFVASRLGDEVDVPEELAGV